MAWLNWGISEKTEGEMTKCEPNINLIEAHVPGRGVCFWLTLSGLMNFKLKNILQKTFSVKERYIQP
jgi:hypothetical protein